MTALRRLLARLRRNRYDVQAEDANLSRAIWFVPTTERIAAAEAAGDRAAIAVARRQEQRRIRLAEVGVTAMHRDHDLNITCEWPLYAGDLVGVAA